LCRFLGMKKIGGSAFKVRVAVAIVVCVWIYNVAVDIPMFLWANVRPSRSGGYSCFPIVNRDYSLVTHVINFYVPLAITWTSYIGIIYKFKRSVNKAVSLYCLEPRCVRDQTEHLHLVSFANVQTNVIMTLPRRCSHSSVCIGHEWSIFTGTDAIDFRFNTSNFI